MRSHLNVGTGTDVTIRELAATIAWVTGFPYRPVGVVESGLVEQVAIGLWRKARFVRAEAALVNLNRRTFGEAQAREVTQHLGLPEEAWRGIAAPLPAASGEAT